MRILVLGADGYLGWPTALYLSNKGHEVAVVDNFARRQYDYEMGVDSLVPIAQLQRRVQVWKEVSGKELLCWAGDLVDPDFTHRIVKEFRPEAIVHFAEQRSAPYSMIDQKHAVYTQYNNVINTLNVLYAIMDIDRRSTWSSSARWVSTARPTSTSKRASSRSRTRVAPTPCRSRRTRTASTTSPRCTTRTHPVRVPRVGAPLDGPQPGRRVRPGDRRDEPAPRAAHAVRLRRRLRHGPQPVRGPGRDRPPAHRLRQGRPDPWHPRHPRHPGLHRARRA